MTENNEMELIGTALQNFDRVSAGLALLERNYKGMLYDVETPMGMEHAKAARAAIRDPRYEVERVRKSAKAPILALGKRLDAEATRITNALLVLETPIDEQIKAEEDRKEREKLAKAAAEAARVAEIQRRIDAIRMWPASAAGQPSSLVLTMVASANEYRIETAVFAEKSEEAAAALEASKYALAGILSERQTHEAEQARVVAERAELAQLRAEQEERDKASRLAQAQADADAKIVRDAELKVQRDRLAAERAENDRIASERRLELDRQETEARKVREAENARLAAERVDLARQQEALRIANLPKPKAKKAVQNPGRDAISEVLAEHYSVHAVTVRQWLKEIDWEQEVA